MGNATATDEGTPVLNIRNTNRWLMGVVAASFAVDASAVQAEAPDEHCAERERPAVQGVPTVPVVQRPADLTCTTDIAAGKPRMSFTGLRIRYAGVSSDRNGTSHVDNGKTAPSPVIIVLAAFVGLVVVGRRGMAAPTDAGGGAPYKEDDRSVGLRDTVGPGMEQNR